MTASSVDDLVKYIENKSATKSSKKKKKNEANLQTSNIVSTDQSQGTVQNNSVQQNLADSASEDEEMKESP